MVRKIIVTFLFVLFWIQNPCHAGSQLVSAKVDTAPVIDGRGQDPVWQATRELVTRDKIGGMDIVLKSVHTDKEVFMLVRYSDSD